MHKWWFNLQVIRLRSGFEFKEKPRQEMLIGNLCLKGKTLSLVLSLGFVSFSCIDHHLTLKISLERERGILFMLKSVTSQNWSRKFSCL
ncbi:hypothetical protein L1887_29067 [Cichorium endivia]|nr:hypothetical protein L1887_29067 [Cichorium endivia]